MRRLFLFAVGVLIALPFLISLDSDPSGFLWRDFITDEGWWTAEARDRVLLGDWVADDYNQGLTVPVATLGWWASFRALGVSLFSARVPSAMAALLSVALMLLLCRRRRAALLLATAVPLVTHARVALPETMSLAFALAAWLLLTRGRGLIGFLGAGALFGAALSAKLSSIIALPFLVWLAADLDGSGKERLRATLHFVFAVAIAWSLLRLPFLLTYAAELREMEAVHRGENLPGGLIDLLANMSFFPWPAPFLYQVAPVLALAGFGAWQSAGRQGLGSQALSFVLLAGLLHSLLLYPADRRFLIYLPALAILAARGWRAIADGERPGAGFNFPGNRLTPWLAGLAAAFVLPGRIALWLSRLANVSGSPWPDGTLRTLAALLFVGTVILVRIHLAGNRTRAARLLAGSLVVNWIIISLEGIDFLAWALIFQGLGMYEADKLWRESGAWWSLPWSLLTFALVWIPLARAGLLPTLRRFRATHLPWAVPLLAWLALAPTWLEPSFSMRDAALPLSDAAGAIAGAEAPTLALGSGVRTLALRDDQNKDWSDCDGVRQIRMVIDGGRKTGAAHPAVVDTLRICPSLGGSARFVFVYWDP